MQKVKKTEFDVNECAVPCVWCGDGVMPKTIQNGKKYTRDGTKFECMKKGYGSGMYSERSKHIPQTSLKQIKYIGDEYEARFIQKKIKTLEDLRKKAKNGRKNTLETLLNDVFTKKDGVLDKRAYNATLMYLYSHGIGDIPGCSKEW